MVDIPGDRTTTRSITVGQTIVDTLEVAGDHDWFRIELIAGQSIRVFLDGLNLQDAYLRIRDTNGNLLYENDDSGGNLDSLLAFTATYTGTYYIDVGAWDERYAGDYSLNVSVYTPPPVGTVEQMAEQLVEGYWNGNDHRFNVGPGGQLTVNLTALTPAGQTLARAALQTWTDVIGVTFVEVAVGGQITFDDNEEGAHASAQYSGGITTSARINVSEQWLTNYGTSLNSYSFQTYVHEIGHALGLGHAGNYNGEARYPFDATYSNDGWPLTIMSYFDQTENTHYAGQGFDRNIVTTPMMADILAMQRLYGLSTTTRAGDTTYGPSWTSTMGALCIFDSGGNDTIDLSGLGGNHLIDLNPGTFSNVLNEVGNVSIALDVIIENAIGGANGDTLRGNSANNILDGRGGSDTLTGGTGADTFQSTTFDHNGDTITDFFAGDRIVFTNASLGSFTFSLSGSTLNYSGGTLTLAGGVSGTLVASAAAAGGVQLTISSGSGTANDARNDFNGDGRSDILWRNDTGHITNWLGTASGGFADNAGNALQFVNNIYQIAGIGDFNGDGRDDILWRRAEGHITEWLGTATGGFADNAANAFQFVNNIYQIAGVGDFNGDGRDDILWRHEGGPITNWLGTQSGGLADNASNALQFVDNQWKIAGIGDFNGDGRDDILWRNADGRITDWLGTANGGFADNAANSHQGVGLSWSIAGIGDFNGDGRDDILWRHEGGAITNWLGRADGGFIDNALNALQGVSNQWDIASIGDFNGDGRDDILWRRDEGQLTDWLGTANGGFADNAANALQFVSPTWDIMSPDSHQPL